jgi:hypothetical protein
MAPSCHEYSVPGCRGSGWFDAPPPAWDSYRYVPKPTKGEFDKQLVDPANFIESYLSVTEQHLFLKLWVTAVFLGNVQPTKVILQLLGDHGAGKTSALRRIQKMIFGPKVNLLSIENDKPDGFIATITTDPIALFDNLDEQIPWLPYALSRLATGVTFSRRKLYTTNDKVEFPGVSWLGSTASHRSIYGESTGPAGPHPSFETGPSARSATRGCTPERGSAASECTVVRVARRAQCHSRLPAGSPRAGSRHVPYGRLRKLRLEGR